MNYFLEEARKIKDEIIDIRRDLHEHPELGFQEFRTSGIIKDFLKREGIPFLEVAKTGVCGIIKGDLNGDNKVIAIRGDIDGLPIQDKKICPYASKEKGKMHACGHDAHTAIALGAAKVLNDNKDKFSGTVKIFFEPAEETSGGAPLMIEEGVLENPKVEAIIGLHVTEDLECGKIRIKNNVTNAASNPFKIVIKGSGGHGAAPHTTIDPIVASANIIMGIQSIISREISPLNPGVITVGYIHGGTAQNIIPEDVEIGGVIRTITPEDREFVVRRLQETVEYIAKAHRAEVKLEIEEGYPCLINEDSIVSIVKEAAGEVLGIENVTEQIHPSMGVESFAYFARERKSCFYFLGTGNKDKKTDLPAHSNLFNIDEEGLELGIAIQCTAVYSYLTKK